MVKGTTRTGAASGHALGDLDRLVGTAERLAGAWGARARASTTLGQERAMLRLFGVTGLDRSGRPLAGAAVSGASSGAHAASSRTSGAAASRDVRRRIAVSRGGSAGGPASLHVDRPATTPPHGDLPQIPDDLPLLDRLHAQIERVAGTAQEDRPV